jgi:hypothetical protein
VAWVICEEDTVRCQSGVPGLSSHRARTVSGDISDSVASPRFEAPFEEVCARCMPAV